MTKNADSHASSEDDRMDDMSGDLTNGLMTQLVADPSPGIWIARESDGKEIYRGASSKEVMAKVVEKRIHGAEFEFVEEEKSA